MSRGDAWTVAVTLILLAGGAFLTGRKHIRPLPTLCGLQYERSISTTLDPPAIRNYRRLYSSSSTLAKQAGLTERVPTSGSGLVGYEPDSSWVTLFIVAILVLSMYALMSPTYWYVLKLDLWNPYISDGKYLAYYKVAGNKVRSLTAEEYRVMSLYYARAGSSHWPVCHLLALAALIRDPTEQIV